MVKVLIGNLKFDSPLASSLLPGRSYFELRSHNDCSAEVKGEGHISFKRPRQTSKQRQDLQHKVTSKPPGAKHKFIYQSAGLQPDQAKRHLHIGLH